jgi:hypothetical protein
MPTRPRTKSRAVEGSGMGVKLIAPILKLAAVVVRVTDSKGTSPNSAETSSGVSNGIVSVAIPSDAPPSSNPSISVARREFRKLNEISTSAASGEAKEKLMD